MLNKSKKPVLKQNILEKRNKQRQNNLISECGHTKILIVDDNRFNIYALKLLLR